MSPRSTVSNAPVGLDALPRPKAISVGTILAFAAAPTFGAMAVLTASSGSYGMICSASQDSWALTGMMPMYALMSLFHIAPWLKLVSGVRSDRR